MKLKIPPRSDWAQIDGNVDIGRYGGTVARSDGTGLELVKIQPVREYFGDGEAAEVGFPFWSREAYFYLSDLEEALSDKLFVRSMDLDNVLDGLNPESAALVVASSLLDYGRADEGPAGWSDDVDQGFPEDVVESLRDEDAEFRVDVLGEEEEEEED